MPCHFPKRFFLSCLGSLVLLLASGCQSPSVPVRHYRPDWGVPDCPSVHQMGSYLGVCPVTEPAQPVRGFLSEGSGTVDRREEVGLACGRVSGDVDLAVILLDGDRGRRRSRAWSPEGSGLETDAGRVSFPSDVLSRLQGLNCLGRGRLSASQLRIVSDIALGLRVRLGAIKVLPIVFDGRGMSRTLIGGVMREMFGGRCLLVGVLPAGFTSGHPSWLGDFSSVVTSGWHGQRVGVAGMATLEICRQFGFSPFVLESRPVLDSSGGFRGRDVSVLAFLESPLSVGVMKRGLGHSWPAGKVLGEVSRSRGLVELDYEGSLVNDSEGKLLLSVVRWALEKTARKEPLQTSELPQYSSLFAERWGAAIQVYRGDALYASVSSMGGDTSLMMVLLSLCRRLMSDTSKPIDPSILSGCRLEVGVIPPARRLRYRDLASLSRQLEVGRHGVIIKHGGKAAGFVPSVWGEFGDVPSFLSGLCRRAGLSASVLSDPSCEVWSFEILWQRE